MKASQSSALSSIIGGVVVVALVAGAAFYLITSAGNVTASTELGTTYPTSVLNQEFESDGVFMKTKSLSSSVNATLSTPAPASASELGKTDLGAYE